MVIRTFVVNEQVAKFVVSEVMYNSVSLFFFLIAEVLIENRFHLFFICIVKEDEL